MNHLQLLNTGDYRRWNMRLANEDYDLKIHLDSLRSWWREMCRAYEDDGHIIPAGRLPANTDSVDDRVPTETYILFASQINTLSEIYDLPAPFDIKLP